MIVVRNTFQVKFGHMKEAVALMKENMGRSQSAAGKTRLLTDLTGDFYTLVMEMEYEDMAAAERDARETMRTPGFQETYQRFAAVVDSGRRDIYSVVQ
jgi:quinol monooxygenase YgiN